MENLFLYVVVLICIIVATIQDLKRREVDNFLNFGLLMFGIVFIVFMSLFKYGFDYFLNGVFVVFLGFIFMNLLYYGHVFAGGDAKLLWAISPFFVSVSFFNTLFSFFSFIVFLFFCGGVYGLFYSLTLYLLNVGRSSKVIWKKMKAMKFWYFVTFGIVLIILACVHNLFLVFGILTLIFPVLFSFAKGLEDVVLKRGVHPDELREGDWLACDVRIGKKTIKADFGGLGEEDIELLKKNKKKVWIKGGIPFVPSFLFGFVLYYFYSDFFISFLGILFG